jgi:ABC-type dipeptide/oligopeptide/nickel transport system permease component
VAAFALRRILYAVPVLLGVSLLVFTLIHLAPGDVVDLMVPPEVPKEIADSLRSRFALTPPNAEWGLMLNNLRQALWVDPTIAALPGVMIFITSMCFNLTSDGLRHAMDVRL